MTKQEEIEIVEKAKLNIHELKPLVEKYYDPILRYVYFKVYDKEMSEDLTADVFRNVVKSIDTFRDKGFGFSAWVYRIAHNRVLNYYREKSRNKTLHFEEDTNIFISQDNIEQDYEDKESQDYKRVVMNRVLDLLDYLDDNDRTLVILKYFESKSSEEIAKATDLTSGNVRVRLHRNLKKIKELYEDKYKEVLEYE